MKHSEHVMDLRGNLIISTAEGAQLGSLATLYLDVDTRRLAAIEARTSRIGGDHYYLTTDCIERIGEDAILVSSREDMTKMTSTVRPPGTDMRELQGCWVTTDTGDQLGTLVDIDMTKDFVIDAIVLNGHRLLPVDAKELHIGDAIIVPAAYNSRIESLASAEDGFWQRTLSVTREMISTEEQPDPKFHPPGS